MAIIIIWTVDTIESSLNFVRTKTGKQKPQSDNYGVFVYLLCKKWHKNKLLTGIEFSTS